VAAVFVVLALLQYTVAVAAEVVVLQRTMLEMTACVEDGTA
jgi:hypothetical protein